MSRDKKDYAPDPEVFRPDRYLEANPRDPSQYVFGFGRRYVLGLFSKIQLLTCVKYLPWKIYGV